jgi:hypothetical protein
MTWTDWFSDIGTGISDLYDNSWLDQGVDAATDWFSGSNSPEPTVQYGPQQAPKTPSIDDKNWYDSFLKPDVILTGLTGVGSYLNQSAKNAQDKEALDYQREIENNKYLLQLEKLKLDQMYQGASRGGGGGGGASNRVALQTNLINAINNGASNRISALDALARSVK